MRSTMTVTPTPRQTGAIIGAAIGQFPVDELLAVHSEALLSAAYISLEELRARYVALMIAAALHAIESARLAPEIEWELCDGVLDWVRSQQDPLLHEWIPHLAEMTDAFAQAAADDAHIQPEPGGHSQIELEFFDQLVALEEQTESRARACIRLSTVLPKQLWHVHVASAQQSLDRAGLLRRV